MPAPPMNISTNAQAFSKPSTSNSPSAYALNCLRICVVDTRKEGSHTDYALSVRSKKNGQEAIVYRRFSSFLQLQQLVKRHFDDNSFCCGNDGKCLLASFIEPVFLSTEFPVSRGRFLGKNSKSVVESRTKFLNAFLMELEEGLCKCPPVILARCEKDNCKLAKLILSFYGYVRGQNIPMGHSRSL